MIKKLIKVRMEMNIKCNHRNTRKIERFRWNYTHGQKSKPKIFGKPKKITIKCVDCGKIIKTIRP